MLEDESAVDIIAPYDAVLLECYLHEGDIVSDSTSVAMFMGTDGYTMNISVDELNISSVALTTRRSISRSMPSAGIIPVPLPIFLITVPQAEVPLPIRSRWPLIMWRALLPDMQA